MSATQYLYVLSNPSMPGLLKIGKTTTHPSQRMAELMSTGVPTPFKLECSLIVRDCSSAEMAAHSALAKHRKARNREFFQVDMRTALEAILPVIGPYQLDVISAGHNVAALEQELKARAEAQRRKVEQEQQRKREAQRRVEEAKQAAIRELERKIQDKEHTLSSMGHKPEEKTLHGILYIPMMCYLPVPLGWIAWLGALRVFESNPPVVAYVLIALIIIGFFANQADNEIREANNKARNPFWEVENEIAALKKELANIR